MSFGLWGGGNKSNGSTDYIATFPENINAAPIYSYSAFNRSKSSWYSIDGGIDYQRLFKVKDRMLNVLLQDKHPSANVGFLYGI